MITVAGAGVAGLAAALELARRGADVTVYESQSEPGPNAASWFAGGMLAPWCEGETAPPDVVRLGQGAVSWWAAVTDVTRRGTLVLAPQRDHAELTRFARRTTAHRPVDAARLRELETQLAGRFSAGLLFEEEAHLDPRRALVDLAAAARSAGAKILYETCAPDHVDVDCRGRFAKLPGLRSVRGEMVRIHAPEVEIKRTIRFLHPRIPIYLVPRGDGTYMIGATMIESDAQGPVTVRSMLELLGAAFALHPGLGEASVIETGVGLRPAFSDNMPRVVEIGGTMHLNGFYRHGFLLAPALAGQLADKMIEGRSDEYSRQRRTA